jgi:hypothetical protein
MSITRIKMPMTYRGRRVGDKYACDYGHWHPSHRHALKCHERQRKLALAKETRK